MMSASTWPGPTVGSWSTSPTMSSAAVSGTGPRRPTHQQNNHARLVHDQEVALEGMLLGPAELPRPAGPFPTGGGWSSPPARVLSDNRLAARPVGAQSATRTCLAIRIFRIELTRVVLPTPGPPVITSTLLERAIRSASPWLTELEAHPGARPAGSPWRRRCAAKLARQTREPAIVRQLLLYPVQAGEEHAATAFQQVGHDIASLQLQRQCRCDQVVGDLQQRGGQGRQLLHRQTAIATCSFMASASA